MMGSSRLVAEEEGDGMLDLHPTQCACQDCTSRRLIREDEARTDRYSADELEDFGCLLKRQAGPEDC